MGIQAIIGAVIAGAGAASQADAARRQRNQAKDAARAAEQQAQQASKQAEMETNRANQRVADSAEAQKAGVAPSSVRAAHEKQMDPLEYEKQKVKGAVRTDFILSAEIMAIALGTVSTKPIWEQAAVLIAVAIGITVFVYGLVAGIVRMDDVGSWLMAKKSAAAQAFGRGMIAFTPWLMRGLSIVGTAAMFMVGGSLLVHGIGPIEHWIKDSIEPLGGVAAALGPTLVHVVVGAIIGAIVVLCMEAWHKLRGH